MAHTITVETGTTGLIVIKKTLGHYVDVLVLTEAEYERLVTAMVIFEESRPDHGE